MRCITFACFHLRFSKGIALVYLKNGLRREAINRPTFGLAVLLLNSKSIAEKDGHRGCKRQKVSRTNGSVVLFNQKLALHLFYVLYIID